jgi:hypothetical protein
VKHRIPGKVSLDRVGKFLRETELLDNYSEETCTDIDFNLLPKALKVRLDSITPFLPGPMRWHTNAVFEVLQTQSSWTGGVQAERVKFGRRAYVCLMSHEHRL